MVSASVNALHSIPAVTGKAGSNGGKSLSANGMSFKSGAGRKEPFKDIWSGMKHGAEASVSGKSPAGKKEAVRNQTDRNQASHNQTEGTRLDRQRPDTGEMNQKRLNRSEEKNRPETERRPEAKNRPEANSRPEAEAHRAVKGSEEEAGAEMVAAWMVEAARILQVPVEELQAAMESMGMEPGERLQEESLTGLVMTLAGEDDPLAFVTEEKLWGQLEALREGLKEWTGKVDEDKPEQESLARVGTEPAEGEGEPPIIITGQEGRTGAGKGLNGSQEGALEDRQGQTRLNRDEASEPISKEEDMPLHENSPQIPLTGDDRSNMFTEQAKETGRSASETRDIMRQIMDHMRVNLGADTDRLEMQLHPASLGRIRVELVARNGVIQAQMTAQNEQVRAALESQLIQLKETFQNQGIKVESIEVNVEAGAYAENSFREGNSPRDKEAERMGGRTGTRRGRMAVSSLDKPETERDPGRETDISHAGDLVGSTIEFRA